MISELLFAVTELEGNVNVLLVTPTQPLPVLAAESDAVQLGELELKVPLNSIVSGYVAVPPARNGPAPGEPTVTLFGFPSVNVVCACRPLVPPVAFRMNRTSTSNVSG